MWDEENREKLGRERASHFPCIKVDLSSVLESAGGPIGKIQLVGTTDAPRVALLLPLERHY